MAPSKSTITEQKKRRLTAQDIHELTLRTLQTYFPIDTRDSQYTSEDLWDVLIAASAERITIEMACEVLEDAPCGNTVRNTIQGILPDDEHIHQLEDQLNKVLVAHLPHKLLSRSLPCAVDFTELPYHGLHEEDDQYIRRGKAKSGTTHFHCYATLYTVKNNKRYTLAMVLVRQSEKAQDVLERLLKRAADLGLRIKRLYLDRGFDNNGVIAFLKKQSFPCIMPLIIRGKEGGSRALLKGRKSHTTTYTRNSSIYGSQSFAVHVVCKYSKGRYGRHSLVRFAYVVVGELRLTPQQVYEEYRFRFGIEASYRLMNQVRARTTSRSPVFRLFLVGLAFLMLNLWSYVKWEYLSVSSSGPRQIFHHLLPLARWRLWLWEVVKQRLGFLMEIVVPEPT